MSESADRLPPEWKDWLDRFERAAIEHGKGLTYGLELAVLRVEIEKRIAALLLLAAPG